VPLRLRTSMRLLVGALVAGALALVAVLVLAADRAERGTGAGRNLGPGPAPGLTAVGLGQRAARDYDPRGDEREHADEASAVVDRDRGSTWSTETYQAEDLGKEGVGIYLDARPGVEARALDVLTRTPGFRAEVYGAREGPPDDLPAAGWTRLAEAREVDRDRVRIPLRGERHRYYLLWITALPEGEQRVEVSELLLFRQKS
jgi:serine/threonine-protein kinase